MTSPTEPRGRAGDQHLSVRQLADRWGIAPKTLYNRRVTGYEIPPAIKLGRRLGFRLCDVETFEQARLTTSTSQQGPSAKRLAGGAASPPKGASPCDGALRVVQQ